MIQLSHISKAFGREVLFKDLSLCFKETGLSIIKGPSGSGKSTLLNIIAGFEKADEGRVETSQNKIMIFQNYELIDELNVYDNIFLYRPKKAKDEALLKELGLKELLNRYPKELSGGQKQRVGIMRALSFDPEVILCDEPTESLDVKNKVIVMEVLKKLAKDHQVLVVSHDEEIIKNYADHLYEIKDKGLILVRSHEVKRESVRHSFKALSLRNLEKLLSRMILKRNLAFGFSTLLIFGLLVGLMALSKELFYISPFKNAVNADMVYVEVTDTLLAEEMGLKAIAPFTSLGYKEDKYAANIYPYVDGDLGGNEVIISSKLAKIAGIDVGDKVSLNYNAHGEDFELMYEVKEIREEDELLMSVYYDLDEAIKYFTSLKDSYYPNLWKYFENTAGLYQRELPYEEYAEYKATLLEEGKVEDVYNPLYEARLKAFEAQRAYRLIFNIAIALIICALYIYLLIFSDRENKRFKRSSALILSFGIKKHDLKNVYIKEKLVLFMPFMIIALGLVALVYYFKMIEDVHTYILLTVSVSYLLIYLFYVLYFIKRLDLKAVGADLKEL